MISFQKQASRINELLTLWATSITLFNKSNGYTDINKASEELSVQLLNHIYKLELINLNLTKLNSATMDLGDKKNGVAYQITSRTDATKIKESLIAFNSGENPLSSIYTNGLRFFILSTNKVSLGKTQYSNLSSNFDESRDILNFVDINKMIDSLYYSDYERFKTILELLEKEIGSIKSVEHPISNFKNGLCFSFEKVFNCINSEEELIAFIMSEQRNYKNGLTLDFEITLFEESKINDELAKLKGINSNAVRIEEMKDILDLMSKIKKEVSNKLQALIIILTDHSYYIRTEFLPELIFNICKDIHYADKIIEETLLFEFVDTTVDYKKFEVANGEMSLDILIGDTGNSFKIYELEETVLSIFRSRFPAFDLTKEYNMISTFFNVEVSDLDQKSIMLKVIPSYIDKMYANGTINDPLEFKNSGLTNFSVGIG